MHHIYKYFMVAVAAALVSLAFMEPVLVEGQKRIGEGQQAQQKIQAMADNIDSLLQEYRTVDKELAGLKVYNSLLQRQLDNNWIWIPCKNPLVKLPWWRGR
ncbi:MAG: DUF3450 family protein [Candidatus Porifericomitaceae bacterium WSBS_2022_MAG_OTU9]